MPVPPSKRESVTVSASGTHLGGPSGFTTEQLDALSGMACLACHASYQPDRAIFDEELQLGARLFTRPHWSNRQRLDELKTIEQASADLVRRLDALLQDPASLGAVGQAAEQIAGGKRVGTFLVLGARSSLRALSDAAQAAQALLSQDPYLKPRIGRSPEDGRLPVFVQCAGNAWRAAVGQEPSANYRGSSGRVAGPFVDFVMAAAAMLSPAETIAPDQIRSALRKVRRSRA